MSGLFDAITSAITGKKKTKTTDTPKTKRGTKSGTIRLRKSEAIPVKIQERYGTRRELLRNLVHHELGWCTDDNLLYIKIGKVLKPVAKNEGSIADLDIVGTTDQVVVTKDSSGGKDVYTISLAGTVENALVPEVPQQVGVAGMVLTANEDGTFEWKKPVVSSTDEIEL
jgi:hypothetical protein